VIRGRDEGGDLSVVRSAACTARAPAAERSSGESAVSVQCDPSGDARQVRGQRRVILQVVAGVVADDVDDRRAGALRVVHVGQAVGKARAEVQQRGRGLVRHARVAVGRAG
jgi:hypothetical protein